MADEVTSNKTPIIVAVIGLIGIIGTAWIANYDKCAPTNNANRSSTSQNSTSAATNSQVNSTGANERGEISKTPTPAPNDKGNFYYEINYLTCDQHYTLPLKDSEITSLKWRAKWDGDKFWHIPGIPAGGTATGEPRLDDVIRYLTWDGTCWEARWDGQDKFSHKKLLANNQYFDDRINYFNWDRAKWTARRDGGGFFLLFIALAQN